MLSNDGDRNIVDSVDYIASGIWKNADGLDQVGAVMIQEEQVFTARDVEKGDDRRRECFPAEIAKSDCTLGIGEREDGF